MEASPLVSGSILKEGGSKRAALSRKKKAGERNCNAYTLFFLFCSSSFAEEEESVLLARLSIE